MAKIVSDDVFMLIKSLTKSEKRYFKVHASVHNGQKKFTGLFDVMDRMNVYDEKKMLRKIPQISSKQLPNQKAYLHRQVLESLREYHQSKSTDINLRTMIDHAGILYDKGLYAQAIKQLDKAKRLALINNRSVLLLDMVELERNIVAHMVSENNESRVKRIVHETQDVVSNISNINRFSNLASILNSFYVKKGFVRNRSDYANVRNYFHEHLPSYKEDKLSFYEKLYLHYCYISYYFFIQDFKKGYAYTVKYMDIFENRPELKKEKFELYLKGLNYQLVAEYKLSMLDAFEDTYKKLMRASQLKGIYLSEHLQMLLFRYKYMHKINHYFMMGDFKGGIKIINVAESELDRFAIRMDKHHVILFYYKVACLYFGAGYFGKAVVWLNKIINMRDADIRSDILSFARILNLVCHYELGNNELADHYIRSTYRFLLKKEERYRYHDYIIRFLKNLNKGSRGKVLLKQFAGLKEQLLPLEKHPYEKRPFLYFDIISWLESKLEDISIEDAVKAKKARRK